jgi:hypothetical protein
MSSEHPHAVARGRGLGAGGPRRTVLVAPGASAWITGCTRVLSELFVVAGLC